MSVNDDTQREVPAATDRAITRRRQLRIGPGSHIGRYVVEKRLGAGGMGVVFLAHDPDLDRRVAIKIVRPGLTTGRARLLREGQAVAKLIHPNVVSVFDVGALGDDFFIAMEYVPGANLEQWLHARQRRWREVLDIFLAAGRGLGAAHRAGLVHRDFKPDNVLLGDDGRVVVSDFGLVRSDGSPSSDAVVADDELELTRTAGMVGTPAFMSPEQFQQGPVDARSDQFSFCVALWLGLFGVRPFERPGEATSNVDRIAQAVLSGAIQPPPKDRAVPARIVRALRRGLSVDPAARFATMDDLLVALRPPDYRPLALGAAAAALAAGVAAFAATRGAVPPAPAAAPTSCAQAGDRVAAVWTAQARAAYLTVPGDTTIAREDAAWFDEYARRWAATARDTCQRSRDEAAPATGCLAEALGALERALARKHRDQWPELPDPRACARPTTPEWRELRIHLGNIEPTGAIEPGGKRMAFATDSGMQALMTTEGETLRADLLAKVDRVYAWRRDGQLLARVGRAVVRIDVATGVRAPLPWTGDVLAVSADESAAARRDAAQVTFLDAAGVEKGRVPLDRRSQVTAIDIEPGGRRAAIALDEEDSWYLVIADIDTGRFVRHRLRIHGDAGSTMALAWAGPGRVVISGSSRKGDDEALWALTINGAGAIDGPPALVVPPRTNTIMDLVAIDGQRALVVVVDVPNEVVRWKGGVVTRMPGLLSGVVYNTDIDRGRVMLVDHDRERVRLFDADGTALADGPLDLGVPVIYDGELWSARSDRGDVVLTSAGPTARPELRFEGAVPTRLDRMRCSNADTRRCFVSWLPDKEEGGVRHALVVGKRVKRGFDIPVRERDLALGADGRTALIHTDNEVIAVDTRRGKRTVYYRERECRIDETAMSPDMSTIYFVVDCGVRSEIRSMPAKENAEVRTLVTLEAEVTGLDVLGHDDLVYSTIDYESRLVLMDGLPLP